MEGYFWLLRSPSQTCHAKPKTQINRRRTLPASFPLVGCLPQAAWPERLLSESQDAGIAAGQAWRFTYDWSWWYPSGNHWCSNIWASLPGAGYGQFRHKADSLIAKFKEAGGTVREIDVWAESPRLSPLWLSASSSACHGLLIITDDNAITYIVRQKYQSWLANAAITDMQMRQRDVAALDAKYTKEVSWC